MTTIRTRVLTPAAVTVALGLILALVPAAASTASTASTTSTASVQPASFPDRSRIDPASLPRGPRVTALHSEGRWIVDGRQRVRTSLEGRLQLVGRARSGYVVTTQADDGRDHTLWRVDPSGTAHRLRRLGDAGDDVRLSPRGTRAAWTDQRRDRTRVVVVRTSDGTLVDARRFRGYLEVLDVGKRVLLDGIQPDRTLRWRPVTDRVTVHRGLRLSHADLGADRAVVVVEDLANGYDGICFGYARLSAPGTLLWRSCTDRPLSFSPDGRRMVTTNIEADGPGTGLLQVRSAATNEVRATLRTGGFFVFPYWERNGSFLAHTWRKGKAAVVRVSRDGTVERVSRVVTEDVGEDALGWSFPQP